MTRESTSSILPEKKCSRLIGGGLRTSRISHLVLPGEGGDLGVLGEEVVQPAVHVEPLADGGHHVGAGCRGQAPAVRGEADHQVGRRCAVGSGPGQRRVDVFEHRDPFWGTVQQLAGVLPGVAAVHHGEDRVAVGAADQPVGRLAVGRAKSALAINDCVPFR